MAEQSKRGQVPNGEGVQDLPSIPGSINRYKSPPLQSIGEVKDKTSPSRSTSS